MTSLYNTKVIDLKIIPSKPGVYIYKNKQKQIIYIGKAINLKKRVSQYFHTDHALGYKTSHLVSEIDDINYYVVGSEIEALVLESSLIKQYRPKYNSQLKDDKSYLYISITKEKLPLIKPAYKSTLNQDDIFYGPFPDSSTVKSILKTIRYIFPYYSKKHSLKPCLYCHLGVCPGPNPDPKEYRSNVNKIKKILNGNFKKLIKDLTTEMKLASKNENFELAKSRRDQLFSINYVISGWKKVNHLYQEVDLVEDKYQKAVEELTLILKPFFPQLSKINRIEAYDISNLSHKFFVGAMTVYLGGKINPSEYRQFKINTKITQDDQYMIKEIVYRRLKHLEWGIPDLIVVDGGKPQVGAALEALNFSFVDKPLSNICIIGLAKKYETIVIKINQQKNLSSEWQEINLPKNSPSLRLLQQLRDEAHRFANRYRKKLIKLSLTR